MDTIEAIPALGVPICPICGNTTRLEWYNRGDAAEPDPDLIAVCDCGWSELDEDEDEHWLISAAIAGVYLDYEPAE